MKQRILSLFCLVVAMVSISGGTAHAGIVTHTATDFQDFAFQAEDGSQVTQASTAGYVVILHFWAIWCPPCIEELPSIAEMRARYRSKDVLVVPIALDEMPVADIVRYLAEKEIALPVYIDPTQDSFERYPIRGLPTSFVLNRNGQLVATINGQIDWNGEEFNALMETIVSYKAKFAAQ